MDELLTCSCQMKTDLENSADTFSFFKENYPLSSLTNNLNALSKQELRCACCLMGVALIKMSQKKTIWERLKVNSRMQSMIYEDYFLLNIRSSP